MLVLLIGAYASIMLSLFVSFFTFFYLFNNKIERVEGAVLIISIVIAVCCICSACVRLIKTVLPIGQKQRDKSIKQKTIIGMVVIILYILSAMTLFYFNVEKLYTYLISYTPFDYFWSVYSEGILSEEVPEFVAICFLIVQSVSKIKGWSKP